MIVVDTNVIAYLLIDGEHTEKVEKLRKAHAEWIAPRLWPDEFLNIVATRERTKLMSASVAGSTLELACELMEGKSYDLPAQRILATARRTSCTACDSQFVCLAEDLGLKLYTFDSRILANCSGLALEPPG